MSLLHVSFLKASLEINIFGVPDTMCKQFVPDIKELFLQICAGQ